MFTEMKWPQSYLSKITKLTVQQELAFRYSNFTVFSSSCRNVSGCAQRGPCHPGIHYPHPKVMKLYGEAKRVTTQKYSLKNKNTFKTGSHSNILPLAQTTFYFCQSHQLPLSVIPGESLLCYNVKLSNTNTMYINCKGNCTSCRRCRIPWSWWKFSWRIPE